MTRLSLFPHFIGGGRALALLALRVVAGAAFMLHGWPKIQNPLGWMGEQAPIPVVLQALAAIFEFFGGAAWILGLLTPLASLGIACTMGTALSHHVSRGDPFVGRGASYELALVYLVISVLFLVFGPGRFSLDSLLFGRRR